MNLQHKKYRDKGAIGALLDEYEKVIEEFMQLLDQVTEEELITIVDAETKDNNCRSIQTILTHVVTAGYTYSIYTRRQQGEDLEIPNKIKLDTIAEYKNSISKMFEFNVEMFDKYPNLQLESFEEENKMLTSWGQRYDVEQIYEHAIVHILRHRRQIERFLKKIRS